MVETPPTQLSGFGWTRRFAGGGRMCGEPGCGYLISCNSLAAGVAPAEILADYPYLEEADLRAALAWGAAASEHRIVHAA